LSRKWAILSDAGEPLFLLHGGADGIDSALCKELALSASVPGN